MVNQKACNEFSRMVRSIWIWPGPLPSEISTQSGRILSWLPRAASTLKICLTRLPDRKSFWAAETSLRKKKKKKRNAVQQPVSNIVCRWTSIWMNPCKITEIPAHLNCNHRRGRWLFGEHHILQVWRFGLGVTDAWQGQHMSVMSEYFENFQRVRMKQIDSAAWTN